MADKVGSLEIDFKADVTDLKIALSEVTSYLKSMEGETKRVTGGFDVLSGLVGGQLGAAVSFMGKGFSALANGIGQFLNEQPDVIMAQEDMNNAFREMSEEIAPELGESMSEVTTFLSSLWEDYGGVVKGVVGVLTEALKLGNELRANENLGNTDDTLIKEGEEYARSGGYIGEDKTVDGIFVPGGSGGTELTDPTSGLNTDEEGNLIVVLSISGNNFVGPQQPGPRYDEVTIN